MVNIIKTSNIHVQVAVAALLYNLLHILAWELPVAVRLDWRVNVIADLIIICISVVAIIAIAFRKKIGLLLGMIPALWAIFLQWFLVHFILGYQYPNGVWWYPIFPVFQGILILFASFRVYGDKESEASESLKLSNCLQSPSIYLHAIAGFLLVQTGQKFVRELVVGFRQHGPEGGIPVILLTLIAITAAIMVL